VDRRGDGSAGASRRHSRRLSGLRRTRHGSVDDSEAIETSDRGAQPERAAHRIATVLAEELRLA
jgi:hypothetical protein